jgi:hypothetical protein
VFLHLSRNQIEALERLADEASKSLEKYLAATCEATIEPKLPADSAGLELKARV